MASFDVGVWISDLQYSHTGWEVRDWSVDYLENSDTDISHTLNAVAKPERISAPIECENNSFTTGWPCDTNLQVTYDNLWQWWQDYTGCKLDNLEQDSNLLVTDCNQGAGGGRGGGSVAVANGNYIENFNSLQTYDAGNAAYSMGTVLQEVGHCFMNVSDGDGDGQGDHDTGDVFVHNWELYTTPMSMGYHNELNDTNECGETVADPTDLDYVHFRYDDCAGSHMS